MMSDSDTLLLISTSKMAAKRATKDLSPVQIARAIDNLQAQLAAVQKREEAKKHKKRAANMKKLTTMMAEMGLSAKDVATLANEKTAQRRPSKKKARAGKGKKVAAKYQTTVDGKKVQWTGRGRMPVVFRELIANGGSLDSCLIN